MSDLFHQLGIDWKLLATQAINFLIVLILLRFTLYKPLLNVLKQRKNRIEKGIKDADLAKKELEASEQIKAQKLAEAEKESLVIIKEMEAKSKITEEELLGKAHKKEEEILDSAKLRGEEEIRKEKEKFYSEATSFVKLAVSKTVDLSPDAIDEKLIQEAIASVNKSKIR